MSTPARSTQTGHRERDDQQDGRPGCGEGERDGAQRQETDGEQGGPVHPQPGRGVHGGPSSHPGAGRRRRRGLASPIVTSVEDRPTGSETTSRPAQPDEAAQLGGDRGDAKAPARAMLRAVGMGDEDFAKPQIGVASSWNEITPCNLSLDRLAKRAKEGVRAAGGFPLEFGTISVSDGISMGHEGMRASLVSPRGHRRLGRDGHVRRAARRHGAARRLRQVAARHADGRGPARPGRVFLYAGSTLPGKLGDRDLTIIDVFEGVGACAAGQDHP